MNQICSIKMHTKTGIIKVELTDTAELRILWMLKLTKNSVQNKVLRNKYMGVYKCK